MTVQELKKYLEALGRGPDDRRRRLSFFSAVIAVGNNDLVRAALEYFRETAFDAVAVYETILQSYLFLGFPRMIEAALIHHDVFGDRPGADNTIEQISPAEARAWFGGGMALCRQVYGKNFARLQEKFKGVSPEIFRWMVIEGYGKVLTRPGLNSVERELAEVAALIVDRRERQLLSHLIGSLNVGASAQMIRTVNDDIAPLAGEEARVMANRLIDQVEEKHGPA